MKRITEAQRIRGFIEDINVNDKNYKDIVHEMIGNSALSRGAKDKAHAEAAKISPNSGFRKPRIAQVKQPPAKTFKGNYLVVAENGKAAIRIAKSAANKTRGDITLMPLKRTNARTKRRSSGRDMGAGIVRQGGRQHLKLW